jgi:hypothetical protein
MKTLNLLGATLGLAVIIALVGLVGYVALVQHPAQLDRLSTATVEAGDDAPVPVGYPDDAEVV